MQNAIIVIIGSFSLLCVMLVFTIVVAECWYKMCERREKWKEARDMRKHVNNQL